MKRKRLASAVVAFFVSLMLVLGTASAEEWVTFPSSDSDYASYEMSETDAGSKKETRERSTKELLKKSYGAYEVRKTDVLGGICKEGFFWSHGISTSPSNRYMLYSGAWGAHPAIYVSVLPSAQDNMLPKMGELSKVGLDREDIAIGWRASSRMNMHFEVALAYIYPFGSNEYKNVNSKDSAWIDAEVTLQKKSGGDWKTVHAETLRIAEKGIHNRTYESLDWISVASGLRNDPRSGEDLDFKYGTDFSESSSYSPRAANNSILFYGLDNSGTYRVQITLAVRYKDADGTQYWDPVYRDGDNGGYQVTFQNKEAGGGDIETELKIVELRPNSIGNKGVYRINDSKTNVSNRAEANQFSDAAMDLSKDNPLEIINNVSLIKTSPSENGGGADDEEMISMVFQLFRNLGIILCVFGLGLGLLRAAKPYMSGFALVRVREAVEAWFKLLVIIGMSITILSVLVQLLYFHK